MPSRNEDEMPGTLASRRGPGAASEPGTRGPSDAVGPHGLADVMGWRRAERARLIEERLAIPIGLRRRYGERISAALEEVIGDVTGLVVSAYWPFQGEPDLRALVGRIVSRGGRTALPVVVAPRAPLVFRAWAPGEPLERGVWSIPVPAESAEVVLPDVMIAPVVGFDPACFRLGYGGGFFDRTLATLSKRPRLVGVGYERTALATIYPQPHDVPMDVVTTEVGVISPRARAGRSE